MSRPAPHHTPPIPPSRVGLIAEMAAALRRPVPTVVDIFDPTAHDSNKFDLAARIREFEAQGYKVDAPFMQAQCDRKSQVAWELPIETPMGIKCRLRFYSATDAP